MADGRVFVPVGSPFSDANGLFVPDAATGEGGDSSPAVADGSVFVGSEDGTVYGITE